MMERVGTKPSNKLSRHSYGIQDLQCLRKLTNKFMCRVGRFANLRNDRCSVFIDSPKLKTLPRASVKCNTGCDA